MRILLVGGGSGGHITPLLAVAQELKRIDPQLELIGVCERQSKFAHLYQESEFIDSVHEIPAGKLRRYSGESWLKKLTDFKSLGLNLRDFGRVVKGYKQAYRLLRMLKPQGILIKGGFVGVPVGLAAAKLKIPIITHDSDSVPGLANRIVSRWAIKHATGMPAKFYNYPATSTVHTGIPLSTNFQKVSEEMRQRFRQELGLGHCRQVVAVIGGSLGAQQLNDDFTGIVARLMSSYKDLGIVHITGRAHEAIVSKTYENELLADERARIVVTGFTNKLYVYSGAADLVITRAGATNTAEFALQGLPLIIVPGQLAGGHQDKNADYYRENGAAVVVSYGDSEGLLTAVKDLLEDKEKLRSLSDNIAALAKPKAATELAELVINSLRSGD